MSESTLSSAELHNNPEIVTKFNTTFKRDETGYCDIVDFTHALSFTYFHCSFPVLGEKNLITEVN